MAGPGSIGHRIGLWALAAGAVLAVCILSVLVLLITLVCAPPLKAMAERARDQAP
jgi:hypothetical protein